MSLADTGFQGAQRPDSSTSDFNAQTFLIRALLARVRTCTLARVVKVTNSGGVAPVGFVDVQPVVSQVDGAGNTVPHAVIYRCPYMRLQGGSSAVILDPQVGDLAIVAFADRDISNATANPGKSSVTPGSGRSHDMADAIVVATWSPHVAVTQYVQFSAAGIKVHSPVAVVLDAPDVQINAGTIELTSTGATTLTAASVAINASGAVDINSATLKHNGVNIGATHIHNDPQGGVVGPPH